MKSRVVVVGGGIIGMSVATELAAKGADVTVVDSGQVGYGCSYGNAGWMTPCFAMPLPMPGLLFKSMKWMMNPEGPLYIKPTPSLLLARWLMLFLKNMNETQATRAIDVLVQLSKTSLDAYRKLEASSGGFTHMEEKGLLMVAQTEKGVETTEDEMRRVAEFGVPGKSLTPDEIRHLEPSLTGPLKGGVYFPNEAHAEPLLVVKALAEQAKQRGVVIKENTTVTRLVTGKDGKIEKLETTAGDMTADTYVLATGSWSKDLGKTVGISVPILGGKGYSMIVDPLKVQPKIPMMLLEKKIAVTPRQGSLRIAGTLELVDQDFSITERRVKAIEKGAREFLTLPEKLEVKELWRGLRPCTPDGVPMMGFSKKVKNLYLACGHQMLGLQSGLGCGMYIADEISGAHVDSKFKTLLDPNRF